MNPFAFFQLTMRTGLMLIEAQQVIAMRLLGLAGLWRVSPGENARMLLEKIDAGSEAGLAATRALVRGAPPLAIAGAALKPVARRTAANSRRLSKRGPKSPI
ncbi:hypothetical protein [Pararhodobacter sp. CCB-MM2]|uniref:hypothetical protein n=1 Tax=Pararhodobacter sp. CCB-MM2 TaxID=1786003 RepID=UPI0008325726|nr:hypothetical protein [Pararhodobacter sp. CCB-MM2]